MDEHKHSTFEVITQYHKTRPAKVISACCTVCHENILPLVKLYQEHENRAYAMMGNRPTVVFWGEGDTKLYGELVDANRPDIKEVVN